MSPERNKARVLELIERVTNGHDLAALEEFTSDPAVRPVETSFMLAFRFDGDGQIVDQWLGSNFVEMLAQLGWGFAPVGERASPPR